MNNEAKKSFFSKVFGYQKKHEFTTTRHMSIDCSPEELSLERKASPEVFRAPRKSSMPLLRRLSSQNNDSIKKFLFKTQKLKFLEDVDEEDDRKVKKERKREAKRLKKVKASKMNSDNSPLLQGRIIPQTFPSSDRPLEYPATPDLILEHHRKRGFLTPNEEWVLIELNEYECLVDNLEMLRMVAKHSQFFEVDPEQLWEEFFEFAEEAPSYDDVVNEDIWQEFRDKKYVC